jgi:hypothetical protein
MHPAQLASNHAAHSERIEGFEAVYFLPLAAHLLQSHPMTRKPAPVSRRIGRYQLLVGSFLAKSIAGLAVLHRRPPTPNGRSISLHCTSSNVRCDCFPTAGRPRVWKDRLYDCVAVLESLRTGRQLQ